MLLPPAYETKDSEAYKNAVLRGRPIDGLPSFTLSPEDKLTVYDTPAGKAEVLYLAEREDFEHCVQALAYRCEPRPIPATMGASTVRGLINWEKIRKHQKEYLAAGGVDWGAEFKRFTANKSNYLDSIILISSGYYSAVSLEAVGLSAEQWRESSVTIRTWHELTHFVCRALFPDDIDAIRDEIFADMIGLAAAFGCCDPYKAELFLGVEGESYRTGGRLENYLANGQRPEEPVDQIKGMIRFLGALGREIRREEIFPFLLDSFEKIRNNDDFRFHA